MEYAYVISNHLTYAIHVQLGRQAGDTEHGHLPGRGRQRDFSKVQDFYLILTDSPVRKAGRSPLAPNPADQNYEVLKFLDWALKDGQAEARKLDYVPLPASVIKQIEEHWSKKPGDAWKMASAR